MTYHCKREPGRIYTELLILIEITSIENSIASASFEIVNDYDDDYDITIQLSPDTNANLFIDDTQSDWEDIPLNDNTTLNVEIKNLDSGVKYKCIISIYTGDNIFDTRYISLHPSSLSSSLLQKMPIAFQTNKFWKHTANGIMDEVINLKNEYEEKFKDIIGLFENKTDLSTITDNNALSVLSDKFITSLNSFREESSMASTILLTRGSYVAYLLSSYKNKSQILEFIRPIPYSSTSSLTPLINDIEALSPADTPLFDKDTTSDGDDSEEDNDTLDNSLLFDYAGERTKILPRFFILLNAEYEITNKEIADIYTRIDRIRHARDVVDVAIKLSFSDRGHNELIYFDTTTVTNYSINSDIFLAKKGFFVLQKNMSLLDDDIEIHSDYEINIQSLMLYDFERYLSQFGINNVSVHSDGDGQYYLSSHPIDFERSITHKKIFKVALSTNKLQFTNDVASPVYYIEKNYDIKDFATTSDSTTERTFYVWDTNKLTESNITLYPDAPTFRVADNASASSPVYTSIVKESYIILRSSYKDDDGLDGAVLVCDDSGDDWDIDNNTATFRNKNTSSWYMTVKGVDDPSGRPSISIKLHADVHDKVTSFTFFYSTCNLSVLHIPELEYKFISEFRATTDETDTNKRILFAENETSDILLDSPPQDEYENYDNVKDVDDGNYIVFENA